MAVRPDYYKDESGHDIFWEMENGKYPIEYAIGFCVINADKYERRLGKKTKDTTLDKEKTQTYREEAQKLRDIKHDLEDPSVIMTIGMKDEEGNDEIIGSVSRTQR